MSDSSTTQILAVDDDEQFLDSMGRYMGRNGHIVFTAGSAEEALRMLKSEAIDVALVDIRLPGMDGLELTRKIRRDFGSEVIVMTGYLDDFSYESAINRGASDFVYKPVRLEELELRINRAMGERQLKKERDEMVEKLKILSVTDGLTKLFNSRHFHGQLKSEIDRSIRYRHSLSLLLLDIDNFKTINDGYGHIAGDQVLAKLAGAITSMLRSIDSAYRYGGEEFTIMLPETKGSEAFAVAERIRETTEDLPFEPGTGKEVHITVSIGVAEYRQPESVSEFVRRTDQAMYASKAGGRNKVSCSEPD